MITKFGRVQIPGEPYGDSVEHVPAEVAKLYDEARRACAATCYTEKRILDWERADLPNDDKMDRTEVQAAAVEFARAFHALLRRELTSELPAAEHERMMAALDRVEDRLPMMLPEALKGAA